MKRQNIAAGLLFAGLLFYLLFLIQDHVYGNEIARRILITISASCTLSAYIVDTSNKW